MDYGWPDFVGNLGVLAVLSAYFLLQTGRLGAEALRYSALNALGAVLITVSLFYNFNLSSMMIEIAWFSLSVLGIVRALRARREPG